MNSVKILSALSSAILCSLLLAWPGTAQNTSEQEKPQAEKSSASSPDKAQKPTPQAPKVDLYGDPLPQGALARMGTVRFRHHDMIHSLAVSPDEKIVATAGGWFEYSPEYPIRLWDLNTGKEIRQLVGEPGSAGNIVFSPDGKLLASSMGLGIKGGYHNQVRLWEVATGKVLHVIKDHQPPFPSSGSWEGYGLAFSPDSKYLATTGPDQKVRLWEVAARKERYCWTVPGLPRSLVFSSDGKVLAAGCGKEILVWDVTTGAKVKSIASPSFGSWFHSTFIPDNREIVAAQQGWEKKNICWIDLDAEKEIRTIPGIFLGFSPDGKRLACFDKNEIQLWDLVQGKQIRTLKTHEHSGLFPDGYLSTGALSRDGKKLMVADWNIVRVLDLATGKDLYPAAGHWARVTFTGFSADGRQVISTGENTIRVWESETGKALKMLTGHKYFITNASVTPDRKTLATARWDGTIQLWDLDRFEQFRQLDTQERKSYHLVSFSPDGKTLAANTGARTESSLILWDWATGKELLRFGKPSGGEQGFAFTPDGKALATASGIALFDPNTGKKLYYFEQLRLGGGLINGLAFSPDSRVVAAAGYWELGLPSSECECIATLGEMATGTRMAALKGHQGTIVSVDFSNDGRILATGAWDGTVRLWDIFTGKELVCLSGHKGGVTALAFSPDNKTLVSGGSDTTILLWDVSNWVAVRPVPIPPLTAKGLNTLWINLASEDTSAAYLAISKLAAAQDQAAAFLKQKLLGPPITAEQIQNWINDLDSEAFAAREQATMELKAQGPAIKPLLQKALERPASLEAKQRLEKILATLSAAPKKEKFTEQELRWVRAVQVLEYIGSAEAVNLLESLTTAQPQTFLGKEAKNSLQRLLKQK